MPRLLATILFGNPASHQIVGQYNPTFEFLNSDSLETVSVLLAMGSWCGVLGQIQVKLADSATSVTVGWIVALWAAIHNLITHVQWLPTDLWRRQGGTHSTETRIHTQITCSRVLDTMGNRYQKPIAPTSHHNTNVNSGNTQIKYHIRISAQ